MTKPATPHAPIALDAASQPPRQTPSSYPEPFRSKMDGRIKRQLGELFGLNNFGVNLTRLKPGGISALMHSHTTQDEFIYILDGEPTLKTQSSEMNLKPGMCAGFPAGGDAHHLINNSDKDVTYLEIGDRAEGDTAQYPEDDIRAELAQNYTWLFSHKDGTPY